MELFAKAAVEQIPKSEAIAEVDTQLVGTLPSGLPDGFHIQSNRYFDLLDEGAAGANARQSRLRRAASILAACGHH